MLSADDYTASLIEVINRTLCHQMSSERPQSSRSHKRNGGSTESRTESIHFKPMADQHVVNIKSEDRRSTRRSSVNAAIDFLNQNKTM